ncbi:penicillin acylase family protein [Acidobacteriota bacterium]
MSSLRRKKATRKTESPCEQRRNGFRRGVRIALRTGLILLLLIVLAAGAAGLWGWQRLRASLPIMEGELELEGLSAPVTVERDSLGVPAIRGANRVDVARATGFLHGQERFFQMDLMRRQAAGELSALIGAGAVKMDRSARVHRFRSRAKNAVSLIAPENRALINAYVDGVNAGLSALGTPPFEYLLLRNEPDPWLLEDTILMVYAMYFMLHDERGRYESIRGVMHDTLPPGLYEFLTPWGTEWDAPVTGGPVKIPDIPGIQVFDLHGESKLSGKRFRDPCKSQTEAEAFAGSNNWAVSGTHTSHGGAILANDMHLPISVPNIWYRACLVFADNQGRERRIAGVTLPGAPNIIAGSNGFVAWGFTNSQADWHDLVILEKDPDDPGAYLAPDGSVRFEKHEEIIRVKGGEDEVLEVRSTLWGPVIDKDHLGRERVLRWVAHDREAVNFGLFHLESAINVAQAIEIASRFGIPNQNFVAADAGGNIGWTIAGPMPRRFGHDGYLPASWADGKRGWDGWLSPGEYPRIINPSQGRIWTANARVVGGDELLLLGYETYVLGARAQQIRDGLLAIEAADEKDLLAVQLDNRALFLRRWQRLLLQVLIPETLQGHPHRQELRRLAENWGERADPGSAGYMMVRSFRHQVARRALAPLTEACRKKDDRFNVFTIPQYEGPLWRLVADQPRNLLSPEYDNWDELFLAAVDDIVESCTSDGSGLSDNTWGARNTSRFRHHMSPFVPGAGRWLDMPGRPLPGDFHMPCVLGPGFGASERMVVSPGREEEGILHMPCGQSGHPLSPHYRDGHDAWIKGEPTPFLPGPPAHTLTLTP